MGVMRSYALVFMLFASSVAMYSPTPREHEAFEFLRTATTFESPHVGFAGVYSRGYLALRIVNRSVAADALFKRLIAEGSPAGQLYGLVGVYRTDPEYFRTVAPEFAAKRDSVSTMVGCIMGGEQVSEIVSADHALVVRPGETLADAAKRQPHAITDISHGGYTVWYLQPDSNESEAKREEARADFKH